MSFPESEIAEVRQEMRKAQQPPILSTHRLLGFLSRAFLAVPLRSASEPHSPWSCLHNKMFTEQCQRAQEDGFLRHPTPSRPLTGGSNNSLWKPNRPLEGAGPGSRRLPSAQTTPRLQECKASQPSLDHSVPSLPQSLAEILEDSM